MSTRGWRRRGLSGHRRVELRRGVVALGSRRPAERQRLLSPSRPARRRSGPHLSSCAPGARRHWARGVGGLSCALVGALNHAPRIMGIGGRRSATGAYRRRDGDPIDQPRIGVAWASVRAGCGGDSAGAASGESVSARRPPSLEQQSVRVVTDVQPDVVQIRAANGLGSGVVVDTAGNIATSAHAVASGRSLAVAVRWSAIRRIESAPTCPMISR
jgi:hypothetical protein